MYPESQSPSKARSHAEVLDEIGRLTKQDFGRLRAAAHIWVRDLNLHTVAKDADDLVAEAILRTTSGQRAWKVGVNFKKHLLGVMRSLANSWRQSAERRAASGRMEVRESDFMEPAASATGGDPVDYTPVSNAPSLEPDPERALQVRRGIRAFEDHFAGDEVVGAVIHGMWSQMKGPEICQNWNLTEKQYAAAIRRIRRYAHRRKGVSHGD